MHIKETMAWQVSGAFEDISSKLTWVAAKSTALKVLVVELDPISIYDDGTRTFQAPRTHRKSEWVHALAQQLAACRPQLQTFGCRARDLNTFPVIPNVKHLMLDVKFVSLQNGVGSLTTLKSLETLHLIGYVQRHRGSEPPFAFIVLL